MNEERLAELERLAGEATPGPWVVAWNGDGKVSGVTPALDAVHDGEVFFAKNLERDGLARDCAYIVAACNAVPELVAEIKRLREYEAFVTTCVECANQKRTPESDYCESEQCPFWADDYCRVGWRCEDVDIAWGMSQLARTPAPSE